MFCTSCCISAQDRAERNSQSACKLVHALLRARAKWPCKRGTCAAQVKGEVEAGISYLLRKREADRYRHFVPRMLYETASGGRQAPTFDLP